MSSTTDAVAAAEGTRWLSAEEQQAWIGVVTLMWRLPGPLEGQLQRDSGLALFEYVVLSRLSMQDDREMRMSELADVASASPSRLSNVVARLEARGWVTRRPDTCDRRGTIATLTDDGLAVVVAAAPGHVEAVRRLVVDQLTPAQVEAMAAIGAAVGEAVTADRAVRGDPAC